jgi:hypothetical protein
MMYYMFPVMSVNCSVRHVNYDYLFFSLGETAIVQHTYGLNESQSQGKIINCTNAV